MTGYQVWVVPSTECAFGELIDRAKINCVLLSDKDQKYLFPFFFWLAETVLNSHSIHFRSLNISDLWDTDLRANPRSAILLTPYAGPLGLLERVDIKISSGCCLASGASSLYFWLSTMNHTPNPQLRHTQTSLHHLIIQIRQKCSENISNSA